MFFLSWFSSIGIGVIQWETVACSSEMWLCLHLSSCKVLPAFQRCSGSARRGMLCEAEKEGKEFGMKPWLSLGVLLLLSP